MATVLLGWELGDGLGHVQRLLQVARGLAAHGHRCVFALRNVVDPAPLLDDESFMVLPAPVCPVHSLVLRNFHAASYADILAASGFGSAADLYALTTAWQRLIEMVRPELIVGDHSPTLCLAAYGTLPTVLVGTGFTVPPAEAPFFPPLGTAARPLLPQEQILGIVQQAQRRRARPIPDSLGGIFAPAVRLVCTFPELDPYRKVRSEPAVGPLGSLPAPAPLPAAPAYFAYLSPDYAGVDNLLATLASTGLPGSVYVRGAPRLLVDFLRGRGLVVHDRPVPLGEVLPGVSLLLHHAGAGTSEAALAAGRLQLLFPQHLEQTLTSQALTDLGVATYLTGEQPLDALHRSLGQLLGDNSAAERAQSWAQQLRARGLPDPLPYVVQRCVSQLL